jgi:hypothetical protein
MGTRGHDVRDVLRGELEPSGVGRVRPEELIRAYLDSSTKQHAFTGRAFETYGGSTDPFAIDPADLLAVTMLSIEVRSRSGSGLSPEAILALDEHSGVIRDLLGVLDPELRLETLDSASFASKLGDVGSAGQELFEVLHSILRGSGNRRVIATHKLLARKRPHLFPVRDGVVEDTLGIRRPMPWWRPWWEALGGAEGSELVSQVECVRARADASHLSILRVLDILIWVKRAGRVTLRQALRERLAVP